MDGKRSGVVMDVRVGDSFRIVHPSSVDTEEIVITLESKHGQRSRLRVQAPGPVKIEKPERKPRS
jgi:hypothetical protein